MKKQIFILAVFILSLSLQALAQQQFSIPQLKDDLLFYHSKLEQYHPNLYLYTSQEKLSIFFDSLSHSISSPLSEAEFYKIITQTSSIVGVGYRTQVVSSNKKILDFWFLDYLKDLPLKNSIKDFKTSIRPLMNLAMLCPES